MPVATDTAEPPDEPPERQRLGRAGGAPARRPTPRWWCRARTRGGWSCRRTRRRPRAAARPPSRRAPPRGSRRTCDAAVVGTPRDVDDVLERDRHAVQRAAAAARAQLAIGRARGRRAPRRPARVMNALIDGSRSRIDAVEAALGDRLGRRASRRPGPRPSSTMRGSSATAVIRPGGGASGRSARRAGRVGVPVRPRGARLAARASASSTGRTSGSARRVGVGAGALEPASESWALPNHAIRRFAPIIRLCPPAAGVSGSRLPRERRRPAAPDPGRVPRAAAALQGAGHPGHRGAVRIGARPQPRAGELGAAGAR